MDKLILEVYVKQTLAGPALMFKWPAGIREALERQDVMDIIGEGIATFGEQLKMNGLGITDKKPATLYGPNGRPIA